MNELAFVLVSALYVVSLATIDGLFNRLIFGRYRAFSYFSKEKQRIYNKWEWRVIGLIFLIFLPIILPSVLSYLIGGFRYLCLYWITLLLVPWDFIFGKLVFNDWFGDTPSIALPFIGWIHRSLLEVSYLRILLAAVVLLLYLYGNSSS